jgi:hypothetical protein
MSLFPHVLNTDAEEVLPMMLTMMNIVQYAGRETSSA